MIRKIALNQCLIINLEENNAIYYINYNIKKICVYWVAAKVCKYLLLKGLFRPNETGGMLHSSVF